MIQKSSGRGYDAFQSCVWADEAAAQNIRVADVRAAGDDAFLADDGIGADGSAADGAAAADPAGGVEDGVLRDAAMMTDDDTGSDLRLDLGQLRAELLLFGQPLFDHGKPSLGGGLVGQKRDDRAPALKLDGTVGINVSAEVGCFSGDTAFDIDAFAQREGVANGGGQRLIVFLQPECHGGVAAEEMVHPVLNDTALADFPKQEGLVVERLAGLVVKYGVAVHGWKRGLIAAAVLERDGHGHEQDFQIEPQTLFRGIFQIEADGFIVRNAVAVADLPQAGEAGFDFVTQQIARGELRHLPQGERARADEAHVAGDDVEELRKLIDGEFAHEFATGQDARVVGVFFRAGELQQGMAQFHDGLVLGIDEVLCGLADLVLLDFLFNGLGIAAHGAEFQHGKEAAELADAFAGKGDGPAIQGDDCERGGDEQRGEQQYHGKADGEVEAALGAFAQAMAQMMSDKQGVGGEMLPQAGLGGLAHEYNDS